MINEKKACEENTLIDSNFSVFDIDINFDLNNGKGAWVVMLQRSPPYPLPLKDIDETKEENYESRD